MSKPYLLRATRRCVFTLGAATMALISALAQAQSQAPSDIFPKSSHYISLSPTDSSESVPEIGSSTLDRLFSKEINGQVVYDIPYPFDKFIDRLAGRDKPQPRILSRIRNLKTLPDLMTYLRTDLFITSSDETQDMESLFPFGRSLQKPRIGNAITNPWESPREVVHLNRKRDPHLFKVGRIQDRLYCGHVEKLGTVECISWNQEGGRFEFQLIEDYLENKIPKVTYVSRPKCLACHQGGAPIFPLLDWLESDDSLSLESGLIFANYKGDKSGQAHFDSNVMSTFNSRLQSSLRNRQRSFSPTEARFRSIKAGKFDGAVGRSNKLLTTNKLWIYLCGEGPVGDACRKSIFKSYIAFSLNKADRRDQEARAIFTSEIRRQDIQKNFDKISKTEIFFPFFRDRDPLTAVFPVEKILDCATGSCKSEFIHTLLQPDSITKMVEHGQKLNMFFNPKFLRAKPLIKEGTDIDGALLELTSSLSHFFYRGFNPKNGSREVYTDIGDWIQTLVAKGAAPQNIQTIATDFVEKMDIRYFSATPIHRERLLYGLWENVDQKRANSFLRLIRKSTPAKAEHKIAKKFIADPAIEPALSLVTQVCISCHGGSSKGGNIPQFAYAENLEDLKSNVFYYKDQMLKQLKAENMPPVYDFSPFSASDRKLLINYLENMKLESE